MTFISTHKQISNDTKWILLIEDNPDHAELVRRTIAQCRSDLFIQHVADGQQALDYLESIISHAPAASPPAAILLDLRLPRVDGFEILRLRSTHPTLKAIPTIVLSTSTRECDIMEAELLQADAYHVKPLAPQTCQQILNRAFKNTPYLQ